MLKREGKIEDELIEKLMNWRHSGFSVHAGNQIARDDRDGQKALAEYILRNAFSEQKITYFEDTGKVLYRSAMTHGSNKKNFEIFTAEEFIAAITQHIPDKNFQMVRYYGFYSNRSRGERNKAGLLRPGDQPAPSAQSPDVTVLDVSDYKPPRIPSKTWRELIKKIWEVDPLTCPRCGHEMKIISLIHEPAVIERILRHLGLWKQHPDPHLKKPKTPDPGPVAMEDFDDGLRLLEPTPRRAGPSMKSPLSSTTDFGGAGQPFPAPREQFVLKSDQKHLFSSIASNHSQSLYIMLISI